MNIGECYQYIFVRQDLSIDVQMAHVAHVSAAASPARRYHPLGGGIPAIAEADEMPSRVVIGMPDEASLKRVSEKLCAHGVWHVAFSDPDFQLGITAICSEPVTDSIREDVFKNYRLWNPLNAMSPSWPNTRQHAYRQHSEQPDNPRCMDCGKKRDHARHELAEKQIPLVPEVIPYDIDKARVTLSGKPPETPDASAPAPIKDNGQHADYWVLSEEERSKGFVTPVRRAYTHLKCGTVTTMSKPLAETYARDPKFYGATFCCGCMTHLALVEHHHGHNRFAFRWVNENGSQGEGVGEWPLGETV